MRREQRSLFPLGEPIPSLLRDWDEVERASPLAPEDDLRAPAARGEEPVLRGWTSSSSAAAASRSQNEIDQRIQRFASGET